MKSFIAINRFCLSLLILYICLFLAFNNTSLFASFFIFAFLLFFWVEIKNPEEVIWYTLLVSIPFDLGKSFPVSLVIPTPGLQEIGYRAWLTVSPSLVLSFLLLFKLRLEKRKFIKSRAYDKFWFLLLLFSFFSILGAPLRLVSFYGWLELTKALIIYFIARDLLKKPAVFKKSLFIIFSWVFFEGLFSLGQYIFKGALGRYIEEGVVDIAFGKITSESHFLFRSFGTFVAPNRLAAFLSLSLIIISLSFFKPSLIKNSLFTLLSFIFGIIGLVLSFSRTSWFAFTFFFLIAILILTKKGYKLTKEAKKVAFVVLAFLLALSPFLALRIESLLTAFSYYGSGSVRWKLIKEALHLISLKPFLGVGLNHFTWGVVKWPLTDIRYIFLQPVHNVYLLLAAEAGLPALLLFLLAMKSFLKAIHKKQEKISRQLFPLYILAKSAVFTYLFIIFLEPFFLQPVFDLFFVILGMLEAISVTKT